MQSDVASLSAQVSCQEAQLADAKDRAQQDRLQLSDVLRTARLDAKSDDALQQLNEQLKSLKQQVGIPGYPGALPWYDWLVCVKLKFFFLGR